MTTIGIIGSGHVGSNLARARLLGVRVVGTASKANFEFVERYGGIPVEYGPGLLDRVRAAAGQRSGVMMTVPLRSPIRILALAASLQTGK